MWQLLKEGFWHAYYLFKDDAGRITFFEIGSIVVTSFAAWLTSPQVGAKRKALRSLLLSLGVGLAVPALFFIACYLWSPYSLLKYERTTTKQLKKENMHLNSMLNGRELTKSDQKEIDKCIFSKQARDKSQISICEIYESEAILRFETKVAKHVKKRNSKIIIGGRGLCAGHVPVDSIECDLADVSFPMLVIGASSNGP